MKFNFNGIDTNSNYFDLIFGRAVSYIWQYGIFVFLEVLSKYRPLPNNATFLGQKGWP